MEKSQTGNTPLVQVQVQRLPRKSRSYGLRFFHEHGFLLVVSCMSTLAFYFFSRDIIVAFESTRQTPEHLSISSLIQQGPAPFAWNKVEPSRKLVYSPCFNGFQCARLDVPMNWNASVKDQENRARVAVAIVRLPAKVPVTDERYGGAIILNPGGPGESGVDYVLSHGANVQTIVDSATSPGLKSKSSSGEKYFDVISFDPRAVNNTTPRLHCFPDSVHEHAFQTQGNDIGLLWDSDAILSLEWARAEALGMSCAKAATNAEEGNIAQYANTVQVVEDMVELIERHGEWREAEAQRILDRKENQSRQESTLSIQSNQRFPPRIAWRKGSEKLLYWGWSYGTILGSTFAAMHPDRVHRVILDGVSDADDHYKGEMLKNLQDTDKIVSQFCMYCFEAGPERCPLYTGSSGADVEAKFEEIIMGLKEAPLVVPASDDRGPHIVTFGDVYEALVDAIYFPFIKTSTFFALLDEISHGNGTRMAIMKQAQEDRAPTSLSPACRRDGPFSDACMADSYIPAMGANPLIWCMDAPDRAANITKEVFWPYLDVLTRQSKWLSRTWAQNRLDCLGLVDSPPAWSPKLGDGQISGHTAEPLLIIGNTHDTVTPLANARHLSAQFPDSVVLQHDSEGHCTYSNPSLCTGRAIRAYFQNGTLPAPGTVCETEQKPFLGCTRKGADGKCPAFEKEGDADLWNALRTIAEALSQ